MRGAAEVGIAATDGFIATTNLESARRRAWSRFWQEPSRPDVAESIVEMEQFSAEYLGDIEALDRLDELAGHVERVEAGSARAALIRAHAASTTHRFSEARERLAEAQTRGAPAARCERLRLSIDQACGIDLREVLEERRTVATVSRNLEDMVPLGSLLADIGEFDEANETFLQALEQYRDVSPFAIAWVCFQLGALWGERVPEPHSERAAAWYEKALDYLPGYVRARVHLAEIHIRRGSYAKAEALLTPVLSSTDPEVGWRLAEALISAGKSEDGETRLGATRSAFEALLERHPLAFADHAADFYASLGDDAARACELAALNVSNRPTLRAFERAYETALAAGRTRAAAHLAAEAAERHGWTVAFRASPFATFAAREGPA